LRVGDFPVTSTLYGALYSVTVVHNIPAYLSAIQIDTSLEQRLDKGIE